MSNHLNYTYQAETNNTTKKLKQICQNIFSIKNEILSSKTHKVLTILGIKIKFKNRKNKIIIVEENGEERFLKRFEKIEGLSFDIRSSNNTIKLHKPFGFKKNMPSDIVIMENSNNNYIEIQGTVFLHILHIDIRNGDSQKLLIGKNCSIGQASFNLYEQGRSIIIGDDCLFSCEIFFINSDVHTIVDKTGKIINYGKDIVIGNHVWCGRHCYFLKNAKVSDNSIVGTISVVSSHFEEDSMIIAGNPAKIIKSLDEGKWVKDMHLYYENSRIEVV